ncbi:MAG: ThiF family adenylyltransferase [Myxococcota bacterium]
MASSADTDQVAASTRLSPEERERYARHLRLPEVGRTGQLLLRSSHVLVVGAGGLGCPVSLYLAAAGVGALTVADFDVVERSNLQRQVLFTEADVGRAKVDVVRERLRAHNPHVRVIARRMRFGDDADTAAQLVTTVDVVVDATDNFAARYAIDDACRVHRRPCVYGAVHRWEGQVAVFHHGPAARGYRDVFPVPPPPGAAPSCGDAGVFGVLPGVIGSLQATEVIKLITGVGAPLSDALLLFDARTSTSRILRAAAGEGSADGATMTVAELRAHRTNAPPGPFVLDVREPSEDDDEGGLGADQRISVDELPERLTTLRATRNEVVVVHCRSGVRSARAVTWMRRAGYRRAVSLEGGLLAWRASAPRAD